MYRIIFSLAVIVGCGSPVVSAQTLETLAQSQQVKLDAALARLKEQRERVHSAQVPLAREYNRVENEVGELRHELTRSQAARDSRSVDLETLRSDVASSRKEYDYINRVLFSEFISTYEASLSVGELAARGAELRERNLLLDDPATSESERLEANLKLVEQSLDRISATLGGQQYSGEALSSEGRVLSGTFTQIGPMLYFSGQDSEESSWVIETPALRPKLAPVEKAVRSSVFVTTKTGNGLLPIDPTLGNALALAQTRDGILVHLRKGGVWVVPIVGFALIATIVALIKSVQIYRIRQPNPLVAHDIVNALREGDTAKAREIASAQPSPTSGMLIDAVDHSDESVELVEEVMYESMLNTQPKLEAFLNVIAVTAAIAPLLGLLGTVTGIIKTFKLMNVFGAGDPKPLISGISEALITTELGLVLAIPALIIHALLSRKVAGVLARMEKLSVAFVNGLSRKIGSGDE